MTTVNVGVRLAMDGSSSATPEPTQSMLGAELLFQELYCHLDSAGKLQAPLFATDGVLVERISNFGFAKPSQAVIVGATDDFVARWSASASSTYPAFH